MSITEYHHAEQENADLAFSQYMQSQAHYLANRQKIAAAAASGLPILYGVYGPCRSCEAADHDTMTDADDDTRSVICLDPACQHHQGQAV